MARRHRCVVTPDENLATSADRAGLAGFADHLTQLADALAPVFSRSDLRSNTMAYVRALLMPGVSGNCWALAQAVGHERPYRLQHLLSGGWKGRWLSQHRRKFSPEFKEEAVKMVIETSRPIAQVPQNSVSMREPSGTGLMPIGVSMPAKSRRSQ